MERRTELELEAKSFERHLRAENKAAKTVQTYLEGVTLLLTFLKERDIVAAPAITKAAVEDFMVHLLARCSAATANNRYRAIQQFFMWLVAEGTITVNPMAGTKPPTVPQKVLPLLSEGQLRSILGTCKSAAFKDRRDEALIRLMADSGLRKSEVMGLQCADVDIDNGTVMVLGKGGHMRIVPFGRKTARALDRYERSRARHSYAELPSFWLSRKGAFGTSGLYLMLKRRAKEVGLSLHPHQLRHIWAHESRMGGMEEGDLQRLGGWRTRRMLDRYGASLADVRARQAHGRHGFGDRL